MRSYLESSIMKRAQEKGLFRYILHNLTDWTVRNTRRVDDRPYGGGSGTIITIEPLAEALRDLQKLYGKLPIYCMTPTGKLLDQSGLEQYSQKSQDAGGCILICGHYEGIDERVFDIFPIEKISLGEYVISSGELSSLVLIDGMVRLIPGVLSDSSRDEDSFGAAFERMKEYPQYSRPEVYEGHEVPRVLLSGDHKLIEQWKKSNLFR